MHYGFVATLYLCTINNFSFMMNVSTRNITLNRTLAKLNHTYIQLSRVTISVLFFVKIH